MASTYRLMLDGEPAKTALVTAISSIEVEENAELPGAIQLNLPVNTTGSGDLHYVSDKSFRPFANVSVIASADGKSAQCIFDGFLLSHRLHLESGTTASSLQVWGQDASWLMNLEEKTREWVNVTDADVAEQIFKDHGIEPSSDNRLDDSPAHTEAGFSLMQRATDIQFLHALARRNGKLCRVACAGDPLHRIGYFAKPALDEQPAVTFTLNDPQTWNVRALDIDWDVTRPASVKASQVLFTNSSPNVPDVVIGDTTDSGLAPMDQRSLADFSGNPITVILTAPVDTAGELILRARALLREADWFVRCEGEADVARVGEVLRVGQIVQIKGIGSLNSGKYYVWKVRHTITADSHKMNFTLVRNAVGQAAAGVGL